MSENKSTTLERTIEILDCFSVEHPELGVREMARLLGMSHSTTGRLLSSLKDMGVLSQNPTTKMYSLGGKVLAWAGSYNATLDVRTRALPYLEELQEETQETISLYVLEGDVRVCVERLESTHNIRMVARIGRRLPLYAGSAGKVFLAFLPEKEKDEILSRTAFDPLTPMTITDVDKLNKEIEKTRKQGYAVSHGEWILEASGVACPIFDRTGCVIAALTISGPAQRFTKENVTRFIPIVKRVASEISQDMGYIGKLN